MANGERGADIKAVAILFVTLSWISVCLRCYVRFFIKKRFWIDDWLAVATLVVFTLYCTFVLLGEKYGTGRHTTELTPEDYEIAMMWWYGGEITYVLTTCLIKVTIGVFLIQICIKKSHINIIRAVIIIFSLFTTYFLFLMIFQCHPISYFWTQSPYTTSDVPPVEGASCISREIIADSTYAHGALSAAADWTLGILPIFIVWNLNMNPRTKISVALILALGAVGSTATVIRIPFIWQIGSGDDFLFKNTDVSIWSTVEPGMGITASSMACLRPLFQVFLSRSRLLSSNNPGLSAWNLPRVGYVRGRNSNGREEFCLQTDIPKASHGSPSLVEDDMEASRGTLGASNASTKALTQDNGCDTSKLNLTDEGSGEIREFHSLGGITVVHTEI